MSSNFFIMLFFTIGIITTIKVIIKLCLELRAYWIEGNFSTKRECFFDFCYKKITNEPLVVCHYGSARSDSINYDDDDDYYKDEKVEDTEFFKYTQDEEDIEVALFAFNNVKEAKLCCKKLNQGDRYIYEVEGRVYALIEVIVSEEDMENYGAILLSDDEKYDILNKIVDHDSRIFEFMDEETASFFIDKFSVDSIINYMGHVFVDLSERKELNMNMVRNMAVECLGLEVSDKFLVAKLKALKSS